MEPIESDKNEFCVTLGTDVVGSRPIRYALVAPPGGRWRLAKVWGDNVRTIFALWVREKGCRHEEGVCDHPSGEAHCGAEGP
jgi:hypothetical protein